MGVNIYLLERHRSVLSVAGVKEEIGLLRRFWKVTELDAERNFTVEAAAAYAVPSPRAVILADVYEMPLASSPDVPAKAHLVLGWEEGRSSVTDFGWDYLPTLGYAVRGMESKHFELHEEREGILHRIDSERGAGLGLVGSDGQLIRRGQPVITACRGVKPYITGYAEADCTLEDGRVEKLLIGISEGKIPDPIWVVGKKPGQVREYPPVPPQRESPVIDLPRR